MQQILNIFTANASFINRQPFKGIIINKGVCIVHHNI